MSIARHFPPLGRGGRGGRFRYHLTHSIARQSCPCRSVAGFLRNPRVVRQSAPLDDYSFPSSAWERRFTKLRFAHRPLLFRHAVTCRSTIVAFRSAKAAPLSPSERRQYATAAPSISQNRDCVLGTEYCRTNRPPTPTAPSRSRLDFQQPGAGDIAEKRQAVFREARLHYLVPKLRLGTPRIEAPLRESAREPHEHSPSREPLESICSVVERTRSRASTRCVPKRSLGTSEKRRRVGPVINDSVTCPWNLPNLDPQQSRPRLAHDCRIVFPPLARGGRGGALRLPTRSRRQSVPAAVRQPREPTPSTRGVPVRSVPERAYVAPPLPLSRGE